MRKVDYLEMRKNGTPTARTKNLKAMISTINKEKVLLNVELTKVGDQLF